MKIEIGARVLYSKYGRPVGICHGTIVEFGPEMMEARRITATEILEQQRRPGETLDDVARRMYRRNRRVAWHNWWVQVRRAFRAIFER